MKFQVGDIVRLSAFGLANEWWPALRVTRPENLRGRVVKIGRHTGNIHIRWHGWATQQTYDPGHIEGLEIAAKSSDPSMQSRTSQEDETKNAEAQKEKADDSSTR